MPTRCLMVLTAVPSVATRGQHKPPNHLRLPNSLLAASVTLWVIVKTESWSLPASPVLTSPSQAALLPPHPTPPAFSCDFVLPRHRDTDLGIVSLTLVVVEITRTDGLSQEKEVWDENVS